jgi:hypothetical protein
LTIFIPCLPLNFWVVPAIALCGFGYRGPQVDFAAMAVRRGIPALELPINRSGFSEASGTL